MNINWFIVKCMMVNFKNINICIGINFDFVLVCGLVLLYEEEDVIFGIF